MKNIIMAKTKLRAFLDERGIRYSWVADQLGISRPHFHRLLEGDRRITTDMVSRLSELLDVPASTFLPENNDG